MRWCLTLGLVVLIVVSMLWTWSPESPIDSQSAEVTTTPGRSTSSHSEPMTRLSARPLPTSEDEGTAHARDRSLETVSTSRQPLSDPTDFQPTPRPTVRGRLLDADTGAPISGASVQLLRVIADSVPRAAGEDALSEAVTTGSEGTFVIHDIQPGRHEAFVLHRYYEEYAERVVDLSGNDDLEPWKLSAQLGAVRVEVRRADRDDRSLRVDAIAMPIAQWEHGRRAPPHFEGRGRPALPSAPAYSSDGVLEIPRLLPGRYRFIARSESHTPSIPRFVRVEAGRTTECTLALRASARVRGEVVLPPSMDDAPRHVSIEPTPTAGGGEWVANAVSRVRDVEPTTWDQRTLAVSENRRFDSEPIPAGRYILRCGPLQREVELAPGDDLEVSLRASDRFRLLRGTVTNLLGGPVAGATLLARAAGAQLNEATTDADGTFELAVDGTGSIEIDCHHREFVPQVFELAPSETEIPIRLVPCAVVRGRVFDGRGEPLRRVEVRLDRRSLEPWERSRMTEHAFAITGVDGRFELRKCRPRSVVLEAKAPEYHLPETVTLELAPGEVRDGVVITLALGGSITGTVFDTDDEPAVGVEVVTRGAKNATVETDSGGRYRLAPLPPGEYRLLLCRRFPSFQAHAEPVSIRGGDEVRLDLRFESEITVRGTVHRASGEAAAGCQVSAWGGTDHDHQDSLSKAVTDAGGRYELTGLTAGLWRVTVSESTGSARGLDRVLAQRELEIPAASGDLTLDISEDTPEGAVRISGRVTFVGAPVAGARLRFTEAPERVHHARGTSATFARPDGTFELLAAPGPGFVFCDRPSVETLPLRIPVQVPHAERWRLDIEVPDQGIRGRVRVGKPPETTPRALLIQVATGQEEIFFVPDGKLEIASLPAGRYRLVVTSLNRRSELGDLELREGRWLDLGEIELTPGAEDDD